MKRLSKEKRNQLTLVILATMFVLAGLWFGLISWQQGRVADLASEKLASKHKFNEMVEAIERGEHVLDQLATAGGELTPLENDMASGDLYAWAINTVREFKSAYSVDIPQFSTISVAETSLLPKFPYQQATLTVSGTAEYHDLGLFIADFENRFPHIRILNLEMEPAPAGEARAAEKLAFKMDIVALVKPSA